MSFVKIYVCDPKLNTACKGRFGSSCGSKDFCYSTTRPECAKKTATGNLSYQKHGGGENRDER